MQVKYFLFKKIQPIILRNDIQIFATKFDYADEG